ncbi:hypothetical protein AB1N83_004842 [Pleurotus pulmonarius]
MVSSLGPPEYRFICICVPLWVHGYIVVNKAMCCANKITNQSMPLATSVCGTESGQDLSEPNPHARPFILTIPTPFIQVVAFCGGIVANSAPKGQWPTLASQISGSL